MSDDTKAALDAAITAHFADEWDGGFITAYVVQMAGLTSGDMDKGDQSSYLRETAESQASHVTVGLLDYSLTMYRHSLTQDEQDDD